MEKQIRTVYGNCEHEKVIEKSRFIGYCAHIESEEEARSFIADVRKKHSLCSHVCYAFISDKVGNLQRFSDDGEPQGTAGIPILEVLKNKKLFETVVAVVRYFGGVKLGAGGLVRAYSSTTAETLDKAEIRVLQTCVEYDVKVGYTGVDSAMKYISSNACTLLSSSYGEDVVFRLAIKKTDEDDFIKRFIDYMQGKIIAVRGAEYFSAFKE